MATGSPDPDVTQVVDFQRLSLWRELAAITLILMEASWVTPWYLAISQDLQIPTPLTVFLVFCGVMFLAYFTARALDLLRLLNSIQWGILLALFFTSVFLTMGLVLEPGDRSFVSRLFAMEFPVFTVFFIVLWLWWRGSSLARSVIEPSTAWKRFRLGLIMLVIYVPVFIQTGNLSFGPFILFLFTGLLAMVLTRVSFISHPNLTTRTPFGRSWLAIIGATVGILVGLSGLLASLLTGQFSFVFEFLTKAVGWLSAVLLAILSIPWILLSYLIEPFIPEIREALAELMAEVTPMPTPAAQATPGPNPNAAYPPPQLLAILSYLFSFVFWALVLVLVVVLFIQARKRLVRRHQVVETEAESMLDGADLLRLLRKSIRDRMQDAAQAVSHRLRPSQRRQAAQRIRQIYSQLLELAEALQRPRPSSKTPREFSPELAKLFPSMRTDIETITEAYNRVRYGELPEQREEVQALEAAWSRISAQGERLKKQARVNSED
jgi:hypothetical protein